jgi:signal transduction histidine kinase
MPEQEAANQRLQDLYRMAALGRLLAGCVHEIATPAGSILSNNDVAARALASLRSMGLPPQAARLVDTICELNAVDKVAGERISAVVRAVKRLARGGRERKAKADLNELLRQALQLVGYEFRQRVTVETDFGPLPEVECYPDLVGQVFVNLLVNAGHAIEGEGRVTVRSRAGEREVHVSIADTGRGIEPADREKVFVYGFTTKPPGVGTGLGLSISRQIVEAHGGTIGFDSLPGRGTTFHVRIPVAAPEREERE